MGLDISRGGVSRMLILNPACPFCGGVENSYVSFPPGTFMWLVEHRRRGLYYEVHNYELGSSVLMNSCADCSAEWEAVYE